MAESIATKLPLPTDRNEVPEPPAGLSGWPWAINTLPKPYDTSIEWPKISIVTPSYNQGIYIEEAIRSVLLQNYPNLEYIIIDGGSTDETVSVIKKYAPWVSYWVSEPDNGQSHAINKGLAKCNGEIFNWLNSDDSYLPGSLHEIASVFLTDPELIIVSGFQNHIEIDGNVKIWPGTFIEKTLEQTIEGCEVTQPSTFFKLEAVRRVNGVSDDMHCIMDGELWVKLLLLYGQKCFLKIQTILVNFRFHENSKTVSNANVNNFLFERTSIVADLQRFVGVPEKIIDYYVNKIYASPKVYRLNRKWELNETVTSKRKLRIYFIKKYVMKQFRHESRNEAYWGVKQLVQNKVFDLDFLKCCIKLLVNNYH